MTVTIMIGDVREQLRKLPDNSVHCCVCSPPYWGLRDYGVEGQIGLEATPAEFIAVMVAIFMELWRVLRKDGTCWVNMGDSYAGGGNGGGGSFATDGIRAAKPGSDKNVAARKGDRGANSGLKPKDLVMMPHRLAIALQDAGWWVRQDIVWDKPNPMPESVRDRCTKSHEYIFLLTKSERYYYDADAIREPVVGDPDAARNRFDTKDYQVPGQKPQKRLARGVGFGHGTDAEERQRGRVVKQGIPSGWATGTDRKHDELAGNFSKFRGTGGVSSAGYDETKWESRHDGLSRPPMTMTDRVYHPAGRNKRSVWRMATHSFKEAHFATFPPELPETCIKAGTSEVGCCPACGAQWARRTDASFAPQNDVTPSKAVRAEDQLDASSGWSGTARGTTSVVTTGWEPTCKCESAPPIPATVLDPFFGAGTTGLVADRLQRNCIGIELNPAYAEIARKRIQAESTLLADVRIAA